jgi:hypothetical protein
MARDEVASMSERSSVRSVRGRVRHLPPGKRLLALAVVVGVCDLVVYAGLLAGAALVGDGPVDWARPAGPVLGSFLGALIGQALVMWWRRRRAGEADRAARRPFETATRTGRLPADVDPAVWRPLLVERLRGRRGRTVRTVVAEAVVAVVLLVLVLLGTDVPVLSVVLWALIALQVMSLTWAAGERQRRRLAGMLERLAARAPADRSAER